MQIFHHHAIWRKFLVYNQIDFFYFLYLGANFLLAEVENLLDQIYAP